MDNVLENIKDGIYIPSIEACWLYKENIENNNYKVKTRYLDKLLSSKLDLSFELLENKFLLDNIEIKVVDGKLYTLDIINVKYNAKYEKKENGKIVEEKTTKQLRNWTYVKGFVFNGNLMRNWKRSSGKARTGENLFALDSIVDNCLDWSRMGLKFNGAVDIASVRAYESLPLSSVIGTVSIDPSSILVIDDYNSIFNWKMSKTWLQDKKLHTETVVTQESNSIWDGQGLMDISIFNDNELLKGKGFALLRNRYFKCAAFTCNIEQFYRDYCEENGLDYNTYAVKDMFGNPILVKDLKLITTPNSIKIEKFNNEVLKIEGYEDLDEKAWLKYWKDNCGTAFGVCKTEQASRFEDGKYNRLSYQMFNTIPFTKEEVADITKREIKYIEKLKNDLDFFLQEANIDKECLIANVVVDGEYVEIGKNIDAASAFTEMVKTNIDFQYTQVFKDYRRNFVRAKVRELRQGKIRVEGDYRTICSNPVEMLYATVGRFNGQAVELVDNQIYCPKFEDNEVVVGFRNPHICAGNIANLINTNNSIITKYMNCTDNVVVINSIKYPILTILQGADMDSDTMLLTNNKIVVEACKRVDWINTPVPVNAIANTGKNNAELNGQNMADIDHIISQNYIGVDINLSQELNSLMNHLQYNKKLNDTERKEIYDNISKCSSISCVEIDKAKKQFQDLNVPAELEKIKEGLETVSVDDSRRIKPYFFKYIGDNKAQKQRAQTNKKHREKLDDATIKQFAKDNNIDVKKVDMKDKKLIKMLKKNNKIQKKWEEKEYKRMDTQMDWLQEELDKIKDADRKSTIQVIQLIKKSKHKANEEVVSSVVKIIKDLDIKIKGYKLNLDLDYPTTKFKIDRAKNKAAKEIKNIKLTKANMYSVLKKCLNTVKKNGKLDKRSGIESITLEILFKAFGTGLLDMFAW